MCVFCKIISNEFSSHKVYEDDNFLAFLDISQANLGHTLVVTKKHLPTIFDLDEFTANNIFSLTVKLAIAIKNSMNVKAVNIINNSGPLAGQTVDHFHIHIIPRLENDQVSFGYQSQQLTTTEFVEIKNKIKAKL